MRVSVYDFHAIRTRLSFDIFFFIIISADVKAMTRGVSITCKRQQKRSTTVPLFFEV